MRGALGHPRQRAVRRLSLVLSCLVTVVTSGGMGTVRPRAAVLAVWLLSPRCVPAWAEAAAKLVVGRFVVRFRSASEFDVVFGNGSE